MRHLENFSAEVIDQYLFQALECVFKVEECLGRLVDAGVEDFRLISSLEVIAFQYERTVLDVNGHEHLDWDDLAFKVVLDIFWLITYFKKTSIDLINVLV